MRLLLLAGSYLLLTACSGKYAEEWRTWEDQVLQVELFGQAAYTHLVDPGWIESGDLRLADPIEEKECKKGGTATLYDDGTIRFDACKGPDGDVYDGGMIQGDETGEAPQEFIYDGLTVTSGGDTYTLDGGYTTTDDLMGGVQVEVDLVSVTPDPDGAGDQTTVMTGTVHFREGETADAPVVDGRITIETLSSWGNMTTRCDYQGMPLAEFMDLIRGGADVPEYNCPPVWDQDVKIVLRAMHEHDGDPDNIHIALPDEGISDAPRLRPSRAKRRSHQTTLGERITVSLGRGGVVWATATCPPALNGKVYEAVYDDGLGLDSYAFYCTAPGDDPYYGMNEPTQ